MKYTTEQLYPKDDIGYYGESFIDAIHQVINTKLAEAIISNNEQDIVIHFSDFYEQDINDDVFVSIRKDMTIEPLVRCRDCIHAKQHSYAPAECQWYCTASLQYHSDRFFCACGERREDGSLH